jgi:ribose transport system substrate-binding protein
MAYGRSQLAEGEVRVGAINLRFLLRSVIGFGFSVAAIGTGWAQSDPIVAEAKANVVRDSGPQNTWDGPTTSVKPPPGKHIAFMSLDEQNDASRLWGQATKEAGEKVGWKVTIIDGRGSPKTWIEGVNQAIALKVDGIVTTADIASLQGPVQAANAAGIIFMGIHGWAYPGPNKDLGIWYNIQQDPKEIGEAQADWIIADSNGKARVVVTSHCEFQIACEKAHATEARIKACKGCQVLEFSSTPINEAAQRQPALVSAWVQKYGTPLYITSVADYTADFQVPALRAGGVPPDQVILVSADGNRSAYERIRAGNQYQQVTVSEPHPLQGYQVIDEFSRAFSGQPPSGWHQRPYLVTPQNVDAEGGKQNRFIPSNGFAEQYQKMWGLK